MPDPVLKTKSITENGTYDASDDSADGYSSVTVDVPPTPKDDLNVTQNGEYNPTTGRAFGKVTVDVQPDLTTKSITANGTYNASADNADGYSQVSVNVPLPPNAYLLKSVANLPQAIASFSDGADAPLKELKVAIEPQQEGSGDPSPTNIRPISGWDEVNITVADDDTAPTISKVYTIDLDGTRYGGTLDVVSGELVVTNIYAIFDGSEYWSHYRSDGSTPYNAFQTNILAKFGVAILEAWGGDTINRAKCDSYICNGGTVYNHNDNAFAIDTTSVYFSTNVANTVEAFKTYINEHNIGLLATLATPLTIQLTPTAIKSLRGVNNVYANTGNIKDAEYFSKEV